MASTKEFADFVCEQLADAGHITCKKMFGEYGIYCNGKIIGLVCNNMFYLKNTEKGAEIAGDCKRDLPYPNAKPHLLIEDLDNKSLMTKLIAATYQELPEPKPKRKKLT